MVCHWILSDSKFPQVSKTFLSTLAVSNNAVVSMVSTRPQTSKSSKPFNNPSVTVPNVPIRIGTIDIFMFHSFFISPARSKYLSFSQFHSLVSHDSKVGNFPISLFLLIIIRSGLLAEIR